VTEPSCRIEGINDSKQLTARQREALYDVIRRQARALAVGWASAQEIDRLNVLQATLLAARRALAALAVRPDLLLTDYLKLTDTEQPVESLVKGDARSQAIAAASVIAKVTRDRWMRQLDEEYPAYGFASHKGYGAAAHLKALREHGSSTLHRHTFRGVYWFESEYRVSATLQDLLGEARKGSLEGRAPEDIWLERGYFLPESEFDMLGRAMRKEEG